MKTFKVLLVFTALLLFSAVGAYAWTSWLTLKTEHFTVFYQPGREAQAKEVLQTLEYYRPQVEKLCGNEEYHLSFVIDDTGIMVDGFNDPLNSRIHLFQAQPNEWAGTENWWSLVGVHEYTHELSLSKTSGFPKGFSKVFGRNLYFTPNLLVPGWIIEGITVYNESQLTRYQGRLNDGRYDAYMAARVRDGRFPSILDATYMPQEYQEGAIYTFGGEFVNYLAKTYGQDKLTRFFAANGAKFGAILSVPAISFDRSARQVFGKPFRELWQDWQRAETERSKDFQYEGQQLTRKGWDIANLKVYRGKIYYQRSYPVKTGAFSGYSFVEIVERDPKSGAERVLVATTSDFVSNLRVQNGRLYYATYEVKPGYANASQDSYGYYAVLHQYDLAARKTKKLFSDEIRSFEVLADGKIIYSKSRKNQFGTELFRWDPATRKKQQVMSSEYSIDDLASNGKQLVVSARRDWEGDSLYRLDLDKQKLTPLVQTAYPENGIELCGDRLFYTANYRKRNAVYCYDISSGKVSRVTQNGWVGKASYDEEANQLYFSQLSSYGMDLYQKTAEFEACTLPDAPATVRPQFTLQDDAITRGKYRDNLKTLAPKFWFPYLDSAADEYGVTISGGDAIMDFPNYTATVLYNTRKEEFYGNLVLPVNFFAPVRASVGWEKDEDEEITQIALAYPVIKRLSPGLANLDLGTLINYEDDYDGPEMAPFVNIGFQYPRTRFNLEASCPQATLKNGRERSGVYAQAELKQYVPGSQIRLAASYIDDPDNPDHDLFDALRGYDKGLPVKQGQIFTAEFSRPLVKIRRGLWNPNVYFEDLSATLFYDQAVPEIGATQSAWGLELHLETKALYNYLTLDWGGRASCNREGDNTYEVFVKTQL